MLLLWKDLLKVSEFTLADGQSHTSTSLLRSLCHSDDSVILGTRFQDSEENFIEEQLLANSASGSGALEHDLCSLFRPIHEATPALAPGPLPLGVSVVDQSITVFGVIFPRVAQKHRLQMLQHFSEHLKQSQGGARGSGNGSAAEAIQMNIFTAVLSSLKGLVDVKGKFGAEEVKKAAINLILGALTSPNAMLRCAAGEALGRMAQVVSDSKFVAEMAQNSFDCLKSARDVVSRTGHSLALGCLHRYVGGMGSSQHLHTSVSILLALAQDQASPQVQGWALHALALIADSGGPMFRSFVEPTLSTLLKLLLTVQSTSLEVLSCLGRVLSALITTVGPELQGNNTSIVNTRSSFLCSCAILRSHPHPVVQSEAILCLQQLHLFSAMPSSGSPTSSHQTHVNLAELVPLLVRLLRGGGHLVLRQAAVSCLRQFAQREAREVCEHAMAMIQKESVKETHCLESLNYSESGLPGILFSLLDHELDPTLLSNIHDTLSYIMQAMAAENLTMWLSLLREVLTVSSDALDSASGLAAKDEDKDEDDAAGDDDEFTAGEEARDAIQPRWPTRVFAAECLRKIIEECCQGNRAHYDLCLAKEMQLTQSRGDYLVLHLSELVRVAFMAATSESDALRLEGLKVLEVIILKFGDTPEPEFPGHVILEQYQAQVGAALRPAFTPDTPSHVTAAASDVCSAWIGSGVARDLSDLRRVYQLLVTALEKMRPKASAIQAYNESALTLEKLSILKAWAEVYVVSMKNEIAAYKQTEVVTVPEETTGGDEDDDFGDFETTESDSKSIGGSKSGESLATLVQEELPSLSKHWLAALKDHALLSLPSEFKSQLPHDGGAFYTNETVEAARPHYRATWPSILEAASIWLTYGRGFDLVRCEKSDLDVEGSGNLGLGAANATASKNPEEINSDRFYLLFGVCMEALSNSRSADLTKEEVFSCLRALKALLDHPWARKEVLGPDALLQVELCNVLHRTVLTRDSPSAQLMAMEVLQLVLSAAKGRIEMDKKQKQKELSVPANQELANLPELDLVAEGGESGELKAGESVVFATLEVCLCVLVRHYPDLSPRAANLNSVMAIQAKTRLKGKNLSNEQSKLIAQALSTVSSLPSLCSPMGALSVLPSVLWLVTGVLKEAAIRPLSEEDDSVDLASNIQITTALQGLKSLATSPFVRDERSQAKWSELLQSALLRLLDLSKTAPTAEHRLDETSLLLAVTVFLMHCSPGVVCSPNVLYPAINAFTQCFQSHQKPVVRMRCVQTLSTIFAHPDRSVGVPFIHSLSPTLLDFLLDEASRSVKTEAELALTMECMRTSDVLLQLLPEEKRGGLVGVLIPILVNQLLVEEDMKEAATPYKLRLHEAALARITQIGTAQPAAFKEVLAKYPPLKVRLEAAVRANQARMASAKSAAASSEAAAAQQRKVQDHKPSIQLTMDFSKFGGGKK